MDRILSVSGCFSCQIASSGACEKHSLVLGFVNFIANPEASACQGEVSRLHPDLLFPLPRRGGARRLFLLSKNYIIMLTFTNYKTVTLEYRVSELLHAAR
jgi:hypothetical protein